jgi:hypothetical protein
MNAAAQENKEHERQTYLDQMFSHNKPIFKAYIHNNTQMVRELATTKRAQKFDEAKQTELFGTVRVSANMIDRLKPLNTV